MFQQYEEGEDQYMNNPNAISIDEVCKQFGQPKGILRGKQLFKKNNLNGADGTKENNTCSSPAVALAGVTAIPADLWVINPAERYAKRAGKPVRDG